MMDAQRTGELIARKRKELGLSRAGLAEQIHVTDKALSRWGTGYQGIPILLCKNQNAVEERWQTWVEDYLQFD